jgi:tetratricopeptide (TPR) repeat protein
MPTWAKTNPEALVSVQNCFGKVVAYYRHIGDFEEWEDFNLSILNISKTRLGPGHEMVMDLLADMGEHYLESGRLDDASACFNEALTICEADPDLKMSESPWLIMNSAAMAYMRGELVVARLLLDQVMERLAEAPTMNNVVLLEALANYAAIFRATRNLAEFDRVSLQAEEVAKKVWKSEPARAVSSVLALIRSNEELGRSDVADRLSQWIVNGMESTLFSGDDIRGYGLVQRVFLHDCHGNGLPASIEMIRPNIVADMAGRASI